MVCEECNWLWSNWVTFLSSNYLEAKDVIILCSMVTLVTYLIVLLWWVTGKRIVYHWLTVNQQSDSLQYNLAVISRFSCLNRSTLLCQETETTWRVRL